MDEAINDPSGSNDQAKTASPQNSDEPTQSQADSKRFFDLALDMLCTATLDTGYFQLLNPMWERVTGYTNEELRAQPFLSFVHPDDIEGTLEAAGLLSQGHKVISFTNRYRCKDGRYRWIEWLSNADTEQGLIYAAARDITDRKEHEDELRRQNDLLTRQAETLRELATPLIPLANNVIIMPLIGHIDQDRSRQIMEVLLEGVSLHQAEIVIIDITGVQIVDTMIANALIQTARATDLLGAQVILTGVQPQIAQTLVALDIDLSMLTTRSTLQEGIVYAIQSGAKIIPDDV
jgi:rsbT co-antagonist protein RsbR